MITQIEGKLVEYSDGSVTLDVSGLFYEIWVPKSVLKAVEGRPVGESVRLVTYHYVQSDPSRSLPVLIGFSTYRGTVTAASNWDGPMERKAVQPALADSYEALFHAVS